MTINSPRLEIVRAWYKTIENITNNYLGRVVERRLTVPYKLRTKREFSESLLESFTINFIIGIYYQPIYIYIYFLEIPPYWAHDLRLASNQTPHLGCQVGAHFK